MPFPHYIPISFMARLSAVLIRHPSATLLLTESFHLQPVARTFSSEQGHPRLCCMSQYCHTSTTPRLWDNNIIANCHTSRMQVLWEHLNKLNELWQTHGVCVNRQLYRRQQTDHLNSIFNVTHWRTGISKSELSIVSQDWRMSINSPKFKVMHLHAHNFAW